MVYYKFEDNRVARNHLKASVVIILDTLRTNKITESVSRDKPSHVVLACSVPIGIVGAVSDRSCSLVLNLHILSFKTDDKKLQR